MKLKLVIFNILDIVFAIVVPVTYIIIQYDLFAYKEKYTVTGWGIIIILIIGFVAYNRIKLWLQIADDTGLRLMPVSYFLPPVILLLFYTFLKVAENNMETLLFLSLWSGISNLIALFFRWRAWRIIDKQVTYIRRVNNGK